MPERERERENCQCVCVVSAPLSRKKSKISLQVNYEIRIISLGYENMCRKNELRTKQVSVI